MARIDPNRFGELEVFARVVELGGFSSAARSLRMTPSAVSKLIGRLEARLGVRLMHRSTRKLQLTAEGAAFHERAVRILAELEDAERSAAAGSAPRGLVRVNCNVPFGRRCLLPLIGGFLERHPEVVLDLVLTDQVVDLLDARADVAIRTGPLQSPGLTARKLGESRMVVVGSPAYLARQGAPRALEELEGHDRIGFNFARTLEAWPFRSAAGEILVPAVGRAKAGDGETSRQLALAGVGLARLAMFHVGEDVAEGRLVPVLEHLNPGDVEPIHAVYVGGRSHLPARVRAFIDYLAAEVRF